jgi:hypothetical protein
VIIANITGLGHVGSCKRLGKVRYSGNVIAAENQSSPNGHAHRPAEASFSGDDRRANPTHQDGVKFSDEDVDSMQKAQVKREQYCVSRTDGSPQPGCAATKEDLQ